MAVPRSIEETTNQCCGGGVAGGKVRCEEALVRPLILGSTVDVGDWDRRECYLLPLSFESECFEYAVNFPLIAIAALGDAFCHGDRLEILGDEV